MKTYKAYGRRKASSWGRPNKDRRVQANRAVRAKMKRDVRNGTSD